LSSDKDFLNKNQTIKKLTNELNELKGKYSQIQTELSEKYSEIDVLNTERYF
jgi:FtsZ-binding cell division protein ZapB